MNIINDDVTPKNATCYKATMSTSAGIFLGDYPLQTTVPQLLFQISTIFTATRIAHALLRPLGLPKVISHVIAGLILGPSFLSRNLTFKDLLFPKKSWIGLNMVAQFSFLLFIFVIGVKTDVGLIHKSGKRALAIANVAALIPFASVLIVAQATLISPEIDSIVFLAARWATTSNIVLACLLEEFNLLTSKLGRLAMSATLIIDITNLFLSSVYVAIKLSSQMKSAAVGMQCFAAFAAYLAVVMFVARPMALWMIHRTPEGGPMDEAYFLAMLLMVVALGVTGEMIGQHSTTGPLLLGLLLPGGPPLGTTLVERLERVVSGLLLPIFLVIMGFKINVNDALKGGRNIKTTLMLITVSVATKFISLLALCLHNHMSLQDSVVLTLLMSCKGIMEIRTFSIWQESSTISDKEYTVHMLALLVVGGASAALVKFMYKPSLRYMAYRRRTIEHSRRNDELRILVCAHHSENVGPIITLLEISHPAPEAPICVYLLHLTPLAGRTAAVLMPYKQVKRRRGSFKSSSTAESDQIVNAFRFLERHNVGGFYLLPFVCIAPYTAMHDDVCSVALDKKVTLVVLPFHKYADIGGTVESVHPAIQAMNLKVLTYAPCSVAILVDHGLGAGGLGQETVHRIAIFFFGGADDREALAYAIRIADNPTVGLSVVRFLLPEDVRIDAGPTREELLDDEAVEEFQAECMRSGRVEYREELVRDGPSTVAVIRDMCGDFSLLIVGRREGMESAMTMGLEMWSEYPELGVIGDILASADFGGKVSTLVVQQQNWVGVGTTVAEAAAEAADIPRSSGLMNKAPERGYLQEPLGEEPADSEYESTRALRYSEVIRSDGYHDP